LVLVLIDVDTYACTRIPGNGNDSLTTEMLMIVLTVYRPI